MGNFSVVPPREPCALWSTQPLKVSTRDFSWGKGGRCVWLTTYHPYSDEISRKSGALIYRETLEPPRPVAGDLNLYFQYYKLYLSSIYFTRHFFKYCIALQLNKAKKKYISYIKNKGKQLQKSVSLWKIV